MRAPWVSLALTGLLIAGPKPVPAVADDGEIMAIPVPTNAIDLGVFQKGGRPMDVVEVADRPGDDQITYRFGLASTANVQFGLDQLGQTLVVALQEQDGKPILNKRITTDDEGIRVTEQLSKGDYLLTVNGEAATSLSFRLTILSQFPLHR